MRLPESSVQLSSDGQYFQNTICPLLAHGKRAITVELFAGKENMVRIEYMVKTRPLCSCGTWILHSYPPIGKRLIEAWWKLDQKRKYIVRNVCHSYTGVYAVKRVGRVIPARYCSTVSDVNGCSSHRVDSDRIETLQQYA